MEKKAIRNPSKVDVMMFDIAHEETPIFFYEVFRGMMTTREAMRRIRRSIGQ